jgi:penicillin-binding protein 1A
LTRKIIPKKLVYYGCFAAVGGILVGALVGVVIAMMPDLPQIRSLEKYEPSAVTRVYSADDMLLSEFFLEKREPVPIKFIPRHLIDALIATEDRQFYRHSGIDIKGILRAIIKDIRAGAFVEGASTITQQLSKTLFLSPDKNIRRKIKEAMLAIQLERRYTKDEILTLYLNQVYFGSGAYGVQSAAKIFFDKSVNELSLAECALVAGMPKAPSRYSPLINPALALRRRNIVLKQMLLTGIIDQRMHAAAVAEPLQLSEHVLNPSEASYFIDYIRFQVEAEVGAALLYKGGLTIKTTLSYPLQAAANKAVQDGLAHIDARHPTESDDKDQLQGALIALDVQTGAIRAMVGGRSYQQSPYNRSVKALRQPGSAFKPIVYAYAIEKGLAPNTMLLDAPVVYKKANQGRDWRPENYSKTYQGEIPLRYALAHSKNIPTVRLMQKLGPKAIVKFARTMGITSPLASNLSLSLGASEVTLLELTSAYGIFANHGTYQKPFGIVSITDRQGRLLFRHTPELHAAMSRAGAAIVTNMLEAVISEGTGRRARVIKRPIAGKTGTTNQFKDALFIGFSPDMATGVWVGRDNFQSIGNGESGSKAALPIWIQFMNQVLEKESVSYFDIPDNVVQVTIDPMTGQPMDPHAPAAVSALFKKDSIR